MAKLKNKPSHSKAEPKPKAEVVTKTDIESVETNKSRKGTAIVVAIIVLLLALTYHVLPQNTKDVLANNDILSINYGTLGWID